MQHKKQKGRGMVRYRSSIVLIVGCLSFLLSAPEEDRLAELSLREKIGQLFVVAAASNFEQPTEQLASSLARCPYNMDPDYIEYLIKEYAVGGVIFLFKSDPATQKQVLKRFKRSLVLLC